MTSLVEEHNGDQCLVYELTEQSDPTWFAEARAHIDGGSMVTTTHDSTLVWHARPAVKPPLLRVADKRPHRPSHEGYLCVDGETGPTLIRTFLTPTLRATILSPDAACCENGCSGYTAISNCDGHNCSVTLRHCKRRSGDLRLPAVLRRGMLYTKHWFVLLQNNAWVVDHFPHFLAVLTVRRMFMRLLQKALIVPLLFQ